MCVCVCVCEYPIPPHEQDTTPGQLLIGVWIQSFPIYLTGSHTKVKELILPYYVPLANGGIVEFIPFPRVSALYAM